MDSVSVLMLILIYGVEMVFVLGVSIVTIVGMWKVMVKAGYHGWESLIPFYNRYVLFKLSGKKKLFGIYLGLTLVSIIGGIVVYAITFAPIFEMMYEGMTTGYVNEPDGEQLIGIWAGMMIYSVIYSIISIGILILHVLMCIGVTESFGISGGYAVGLILVPFVFYPMIGFSKKIHYICPGGYKNLNNGGQVYPGGYGQNPNYQNGYNGGQNYQNYQNYQNNGNQYYQNGSGQGNA